MKRTRTNSPFLLLLSCRCEEDQARDGPGEPVLGGDGRLEGLRLRGRQAAERQETKIRQPEGHREAHVLQVLEELHTRVALEEAHQVRVRARAQGPVPLLCGAYEATGPRVQTHPTVPSRSERVRDRPELRSVQASAGLILPDLQTARHKFLFRAGLTGRARRILVSAVARLLR